eukprot:Opistho-1_new@65370
MALNGVPVTPTGGVIIPPGERMMFSQTGVQFSIESAGGYPGHGGSYYGKGDVILTDRRILFVTKPPLEVFKSFALPFELIYDAKLNQPIFGANNFSGKVDPVSNGGLAGTGEFKLTFKNGGAAEFATLYLHMNSSRPPQQAAPMVDVTRIFQQNGQPAPIHGANHPSVMTRNTAGYGGRRRPLEANPSYVSSNQPQGYGTYPAAAPPPYTANAYPPGAYPQSQGAPVEIAADVKAREAGHSTVSTSSPSYRPAASVDAERPVQGAPAFNEPPPAYYEGPYEGQEAEGPAYNQTQGGSHRYPM